MAQPVGRLGPAGLGAGCAAGGTLPPAGSRTWPWVPLVTCLWLSPRQLPAACGLCSLGTAWGQLGHSLGLACSCVTSPSPPNLPPPHPPGLRVSPPEGISASGMQEPVGARGPHHTHAAMGTWELQFEFLLCKEQPDLTQEQEKKNYKSLAPASSMTTMVDPVIPWALRRGLKHLQLRNLGVRLRRKASWIWGVLEGQTGA